MSLKEMRDELRALRKEKTKPVSRMKKADIASEIEKMKSVRETTPAPAATPSVAPKKMKPAVESVKEAKAAQFPVAPAKAVKEAKAPKAPKAAPKAEPEKKKSKMERLKELMEEASDEE